MTPHEQTRKILGSWQLWIGVAYFGLAAVVVALYVQNGQLGRESFRRHAQAEAIAAATYAQCVASGPQLVRVNAFLEGVQELGSSLLENSLLAHTAAPANTELYRIQTENIARLRRSVRLIAGLRFPIPTLADCSARRAKTLASG